MLRNYLIANWKMNLPPAGLERYFEAINRTAPGSAATVIVAPPYPFLAACAELAGDVLIAAQNCSDRTSGAFTGEVAASMAHETGARYVIVGHSERRGLYGETDSIVAAKVTQATAAGLVPVLCIGEELAVRDGGRAGEFLGRQIEAVAPSLGEDDPIVLAYEPVWAIGTGRNASGSLVAETVGLIRDAMKRFWPASVESDCPILYGGSVTPDNIADLWGTGAIQGFLVGGASLDAGKFGTILERMGSETAPVR